MAWEEALELAIILAYEEGREDDTEFIEYWAELYFKEGSE